jgi:hypothetical protein
MAVAGLLLAVWALSGWRIRPAVEALRAQVADIPRRS